jgi:hypothetical protein
MASAPWYAVDRRLHAEASMVNFLEQLVAEWYEFQGYFVRRNVRVGPRPRGGHAGELDVVAFHPGKNHLVHVEPSMDALGWAEREQRYKKKFELGRKYIPKLFQDFELPAEIEQIALLVFGSSRNRPKLGGGRLLMIGDLMLKIQSELSQRRIDSSAVHEQYVILRSLQFAVHYWR